MNKYYCNIIGVNKRVALARILALNDDLHYIVDFNVLLDTPDHRKEIEDNEGKKYLVPTKTYSWHLEHWGCPHNAYDTEICKGDVEGTVDISFCCEYSAPMEWLKELSVYCDFIFEYYTDDDVKWTDKGLMFIDNTRKFKCYAGIIEEIEEEEK